MLVLFDVEKIPVEVSIVIFDLFDLVVFAFLRSLKIIKLILFIFIDFFFVLILFLSRFLLFWQLFKKILNNLFQPLYFDVVKFCLTRNLPSYRFCQYSKKSSGLMPRSIMDYLRKVCLSSIDITIN